MSGSAPDGRGGSGGRGRPRFSPRSRRGPVESVGQLLPRLLGEMGLDETARAVRVLHAWDEALGPELAPHCRPMGLRGDVAHAHVRDSAWMQRVQLEKPRILSRLRSALGEAAPHDLRLRIGVL